MSKWEMVKLGDVCKFINGDRGKNYPSSKTLLSKVFHLLMQGMSVKKLLTILK